MKLSIYRYDPLNSTRAIGKIKELMVKRTV